MPLNLSVPLDAAPQKEMEFLNNLYFDSSTNTCRVVWLEEVADVEAILATPISEYLIESLSSSDLFLEREKFLTPAYLKRLKFQFEEGLDPGIIECSIDAAPYFGLPNKNPKVELEAVRDFLLDIKSTFAEYYNLFPNTTRRLVLSYSNDNGTSAKGFEFGKRDMPSDEVEFLNYKEKMFEEKIKTCEHTAAWLKHKYSMLQKIGPHSGCRYTTEDLFDEQSDPYRPILEKIIENKKNAPPSKPDITPDTKPYVFPRKRKNRF